MRARPCLSFQFWNEPKVAFCTHRKMPEVVFGGLRAPLLPVRAVASHPPGKPRCVESSPAAHHRAPKGVGRHLYSMSCRLRPRSRFHS